MIWVMSSIEFAPPLPTPWTWSIKYYLIGFPSALMPTIEGSNLWRMKIKMDHLGKASRKRVAVLLDFVQITSTPPPPNLDNLYHFFWTPMCQKIWAGVSPSLPIPKLTQYIQFVKSGQKIWAGPSPPLIWTKSKRTATFFGKPSLRDDARYQSCRFFF